MTLSTVLGLLVRHALVIAGAMLARKGWVDADAASSFGDLAPEIVGALMVGGALAWSWVQKQWADAKAKKDVAVALTVDTTASLKAALSNPTCVAAAECLHPPAAVADAINSAPKT